jgi:hypothetical protein
VGSAGVATNLNGHGHQIMELERYTTSNKIWATRSNGLCLRWRVRVEVRAKS